MNQQQLYKHCPHCHGVASLKEGCCTGCDHTFASEWTHHPPVAPSTVSVQPSEQAPPLYQSSDQLRTCVRCQHEIPDDALFCHRCGREQRLGHQPYHRKSNLEDIQLAAGTHSAVMAFFLSLVVIGVGQIYNRQIIKGVLFALVALVIVPLTEWQWWLPLAIVSTIDAYFIGKKLARGNRVGQWEMF
jgi:TM2 domain-containing membrane protein YozV/RNA polymerase subunit RPABC4/transcription elongation factor Spt4